MSDYEEHFRQLFDKKELRRLNALLDVKKTRIDFATNHHKNTDEMPMDFSEAHFIKGLYNSIAPEIVVIGGTQVMKSEWLIVDHLAMAFNGYSVFYILRNTEAKNTYVQGRLNNCLQAVPLYRKLMKEAIFDRMDIKKFGKGRIKYVGSGVEAEFREYPSSSLYCDEVNDCNWENVKLGFSRMDNSPYKFKRFVGNSKTADHPLEKLYAQSNQQTWQVPCIACGKLNELDWYKTIVSEITDSSGNVVDYRLRDKEFRRGCGRDIHAICVHCGGAIERLSPKGIWVPGNDEFSREGFHIPSVVSSAVSVSELWEEFRRGINNPKDMQIFYTRRLAIPYAATGSKLTDGLLEACAKGPEMVIQEGRAFIPGDSHGGPCTMGVDVSVETLDVRISLPLSGNRRKALFIGKIDGRGDWAELHELIERYNVIKACIDIQPEQGKAMDFQETANCDIWLVKMGKGGQGKTASYNYVKRIVSPDKTEVMDRTFSQLISGKNILPVNYSEVLSGEYTEEMCKPVKEFQIDKVTGNPKHIWTSGGKDHQRLADVYDFLATRLFDEDCSVLGEDCIYDFRTA